MNPIKIFARGLIGLVVDDVGFAAAVVGWIALVWLLVASVLPPSPLIAVALFCGLAAILVESVVRRSGATR